MISESEKIKKTLENIIDFENFINLVSYQELKNKIDQGYIFLLGPMIEKFINQFA